MPTQFAVADQADMLDLIAANPLGALVRLGPGGLEGDHIPFELAAPTDAAPHGLLRAHVARANPIWRADDASVLVLFQGASSYVSPLLYDVETAGGRVVPTWNYQVVHAHGRLRAIDDPAWILGQMTRLTGRHEDARDGWKVEDAPREFIDRIVRTTVGIEIAIERLEAKFKMSQNRTPDERARVLAAMA
ncbi:FMN-binding negative transcriptional regulator [Telluria mixta]|uniref:FMN-binding negative transcriptional regulator n=1 Tax=Telluria mixta TaxID=34071 RepID=A0ABT2BUT2_9BURK|nr:FMN-binding negative transcriptional regulator [Telluria mixta]MCS0628885.1 FMN-binding negative transcriptional regulator [Telluria mixta]WEM97338.1 FMN-binding negative transcriptional regulator [Telluria mixta]